MVLSFSAGISAATITPQGTPAAESVLSTSSRRCGLAARGSSLRASAWSSVPMETNTLTRFFRAIAASHDTNLSVVAPGIAEALFATALGLVAAIPAVIFYNRFMNELGRLSVKLEGFANEFSAYLSRKLDEKVR